jgi:hypothetical protein
MAAAPPNARREPREPELKSMRAGKILFGEDENKDAPHLVGLGSGSRGSRGSRPITAALQVLDEAALLGVTLAVAGSFIDWSARQVPPEAFLVRLAAAKPELIRLLDGGLCRHCGEGIDWRAGHGLAFADGAVAHVACADQLEVARLLAAGQRAVLSPDALADEAEVMLHGGPLP